MAPTVLVVDDDRAMVYLLSAELESMGFEVETASNGAEALERVEAHRPDVIVLDLEMPVMDGATFFSELRSRGVDTPVLILSAFRARRARKALGADAAMEKPFDAELLGEQLQRLVGPRRD